MKKIAVILLSVIAVGAIAQSFEDVSMKTAIDLKKSATIINSNFDLITAQADTNATTDATVYVPGFVGQILVGGDGAGTNAVWISKGTTTNDWVKILP